MLTDISYLTALLVAALYPLCFLISVKNPLGNYFHRFHIGLATVLCGICTIILANMYFERVLFFPAFFWLGLLLTISWYSWSKESVSPFLLAAPSAVGLFVIYGICSVWFLYHIVSAFAALILGGLILCISLFAMNLGHWYLNVRGLPIAHLQRATNTFAGFLALRALVDFTMLLTQKTVLDGDTVSIIHFMLTMDGFLLWLGIFFGTVFPLSCMYFVKGALEAKNTQATTGILYALLVSVIIGDITYKYYLIKFGIAL